MSGEVVTIDTKPISALPAPTRSGRLKVFIGMAAGVGSASTLERLRAAGAAGTLAPEQIDDASIAARLWTACLPDPDLVVRTGGELRLSNFLLYQSAYAELWATPAPWPEFDGSALDRALEDFTSRERRFGC